MVAPAAVQGVLNAGQARIPPPSAETDEGRRLQSLAAVADVQNALKSNPEAPQAAPGAAWQAVLTRVRSSRSIELNQRFAQRTASRLRQACRNRP